MRRMNLLKSIIVIGLSLMLVATFTNFVFAESELDWDEAQVVDNNNVTTNNTLNTVNNTLTTTNTNTNTSTNTITTTNVNNTTNNTTNNSVSSNALAYTGSGETGGIMAVALVVGVLASVYSYKKFREYKNI